MKEKDIKGEKKRWLKQNISVTAKEGNLNISKDKARDQDDMVMWKSLNSIYTLLSGQD